MSYSYTGLFKADSSLTSMKALYHLSSNVCFECHSSSAFVFIGILS